MGDWADNELDNAYSSDDPWDEEDDEDEWVLACGYPGCCMPWYHFRSECHNADDIEAHNAESESERATDPTSAKPR